MSTTTSSQAEQRHPFTMIDNAVILNFKLNPQEVSLYVAISQHINHKTGTAWPSITRLQQLTGMARGTIVKYTRSLEAKNLIHVTRRKKSGTKENANNLYTLLDPHAQEGEEVQEPEQTPSANYGAQTQGPAAIPEPEHDPVYKDNSAPPSGEGGSSKHEPEVVHAVNDGSSPDRLEVVHVVDGNQTYLNQTETTQMNNNQTRGGTATTPHQTPNATDDTSELKNSSAPPKSSNSSNKKSDWEKFCHALADICQLDFEANKGYIRRIASQLWQRRKGFTIRDLEIFETFWYERDWRGQKGDIPRPDEVAKGIRAAVEFETKKKKSKKEPDRYRYIRGEFSDLVEY
jgi:hypothetical protein